VRKPGIKSRRSTWDFLEQAAESGQGRDATPTMARCNANDGAMQRQRWRNATPTMEGRLVDLQGLAELADRAAGRQHGVGIPELPDDLLRRVALALSGHRESSFPHSRGCWTLIIPGPAFGEQAGDKWLFHACFAGDACAEAAADETRRAACLAGCSSQASSCEDSQGRETAGRCVFLPRSIRCVRPNGCCRSRYPPTRSSSVRAATRLLPTATSCGSVRPSAMAFSPCSRMAVWNRRWARRYRSKYVLRAGNRRVPSHSANSWRCSLRNRYWADLLFFRFSTATIINTANTQPGISGFRPGPVRGHSRSAFWHISGTRVWPS